MKRVSITFLPLSRVIARAQVLQTPPYTLINYAAALNTYFLLSTSKDVLDSLQFSAKTYCKDINFFLTKHHQYILPVNSQTVNIFHSKMWITTTTIESNKKQFVTLITPVSRFGIRTASALSVRQWYPPYNIRHRKDQLSNKSSLK
ncbi:MAG: hypothetical protein H7122_08905 [Chitinophagaceae bacterium]|nr:hypothetical protein [Chitinophagaceae bacterium]